MKTFFVALLLSLFLLPHEVQAQEIPSYTVTPDGEERITGRIVDYDGGYNLIVRDDRGFLERVKLRSDALISPPGFSFPSGTIVSILGVNTGGYLLARELDTP